MRADEDDKILKEFGSRLRLLRLSRGLTQENIAEEAGFSRSYYTEIETGKRNISLLNLYRLAFCLQVEPKERRDNPAAPNRFTLEPLAKTWRQPQINARRRRYNVQQD